MVQIVDMTTEEQLDMYMKRSKKEICKMLIEANRHLKRLVESSAGTGYSPPNVTDKYCGSGMCVEQCEKCEEVVKTTQIKTQRLITKSKKI